MTQNEIVTRSIKASVRQEDATVNPNHTQIQLRIYRHEALIRKNYLNSL